MNKEGDGEMILRLWKINNSLIMGLDVGIEGES